MTVLDLSTARWRKSSRSSATNTCVEVALLDVPWRKSTRSNAGNTCVEVAFSGPAVGVRDSKNPTGPALAFPHSAWRAFLATQ
ncbi:DUF397 domain-containing protein [Solihabitans fulvus]|uniref:DUF397 domain-containing protein n=1 Tax=Solihabitans fulvus TaxID=1892852 RepID=A0A5B2WJU7_9PSEU|nr:DUF397 domain-containing protein [Solihabitans fulvus]KAA2252131.1 DUF397 domain-containing protein [Solihabitans fulvus]